jgi:hypothetical protein
MAAVAVACGDDDEPNGDGGLDAAVSDSSIGNADSAAPDAGGGAPFGPCTSDADCPDNTFCDKEIASMVALGGAPSGMIDQSLFPGGSCSPKPLTPYDSMAACDSSLPQPVQGCGPNGRCVLESLNDQTLAGCRAACEPSSTTSGCQRSGYTCDWNLHACIEGCRADAECRVQVRDNNNDGQADSLVYDTESSAVCDPKTSRCSHPGSASVPIGSSCQRLDDCMAGDQCLEGPRAAGGIDFPGGYCTRAGCDISGRECAGDAVCQPLRPWLGAANETPLCLLSCDVGAESDENKLGAKGHGEGCREGYRCHYNGGEGAADGVCVGGVYNDIRTNNIGKACTSNNECYSPYGYGQCLIYSATEARIRAPRGSCTLIDCAAPGLPDDVCGAGNECIAFSGDLTFCIHNCTTADECAEGYACTDDDEDPSSPNVCYPACARTADCRTTERCQLAAGATAGRCIAM